MSFKSIIRELKDGIGSMSRRGVEGKHWRNRTRSFVAPDMATYTTPSNQGQWANLPPELLLDIIRRVEESETAWPARTVVVFCASVCRSWRDITKEIVKTLEECGRLTFPISLKQVLRLIHFEFYIFVFWVNCTPSSYLICVSSSLLAGAPRCSYPMLYQEGSGNFHIPPIFWSYPM